MDINSIRFDNTPLMILTASAVTVATFLLLLPTCPVPQESNIKERKLQQLEVEKTQNVVTEMKLNTEKQQKPTEISTENEKQSSNLEFAKTNDVLSVDATQCSKSEPSKSREVSSHGTLQYVQPRVRFFERTAEIEQFDPIDAKRKEYRTLLFLEGNENLTTGKIFPREVRQQDITEYKIEKYTVNGYQMPEVLEEYTCRDDDF